MQLSTDSYKWAAHEALARWNGHEGETHQRLTHAVVDSDADLQTFRAFLSKWGIARHLAHDVQPKVFAAFIEDWRSDWQRSTTGNASAFATVEAFAKYIPDRGWSKGVLTSLASKLAFMSNPTVFAPYDRIVRGALRKRGFAVRDHDYQTYMRAFLSVCASHATILDSEAEAAAAAAQRTATPSLMRMRIADQMLMHEGGFRS